MPHVSAIVKHRDGPNVIPDHPRNDAGRFRARAMEVNMV
jgi:hypothetical protein